MGKHTLLNKMILFVGYFANIAYLYVPCNKDKGE